MRLLNSNTMLVVLTRLRHYPTAQLDDSANTRVQSVQGGDCHVMGIGVGAHSHFGYYSRNARGGRCECGECHKRQ